MKQLIYILALLPLSIMAQVGIGETKPTAALEVSTETTGISALRLEPLSTLSQVPVGTKTGQLAVINNVLYMYDDVRANWLSVEQTALEFGRPGSGSTPGEIEFGGGDLQNGPRMPFDGTIVSISISATSDVNSREIGLFLNGVGVPNNDSLLNLDGIYTLDPTSLTFLNTNFDVEFLAGDMLSLALLDGSVNDILNLIVTLNVKWRKD